MVDEALWRVYFWVNGVAVAVPTRAKTAVGAKRAARVALSKLTPEPLVPGGVFMGDEECEEGRLL